MNNWHKRGFENPCRRERNNRSVPSEPRLSQSIRRHGASITLAILAAALLLPSLYYPFARDQGVFAYVGSMILRGDVPYRDVWEVKPPGIYYLYAALLACTGRSMGGVRAADLVSAVATALLLRAALMRFVDRDAAWLGALFSAALYLRLGFWGMAQAESFVNLCTMAALVAWLGGSGVQTFRRPSVQTCGRAREEGTLTGTAGTLSARGCIGPIAAGASSAAALLLKVTALPSLAAILGAVSLLRGLVERWPREAQRAAFFGCGLLPPLALVMVGMIHSGAAAAYLEIQRGFVAGYVAMSPAASGAAAAGWRYFWNLFWLPGLLAAGGLVVISAPARLFLTTWLAAAVASVVVQRKYFGYHWTPVLLPLAALAGAGLARGLQLLGSRLLFRSDVPKERDADGRLRRACGPTPARWQGRCVVCLLGAASIAGWSVARPVNGYGVVAQVMTGRLPLDRYWSRFGRPYHGDFSFLADRWAAAYLRRHTRSSEPVYIWGFEPLTLFLAGRYAPSRFAFAVPLVAPWSPPRWREELLRELRARPPALFGVMRHDAIPWASGRKDDSAAQLQAFPALRALVRDQYRYETTIEDLTLYRRRGERGRSEEGKNARESFEGKSG